MPGGNKDKVVVLLCAPSGKAAFLIKGSTLHTAFALPVTQFGGRMPELSPDLANTIREKLMNVKLLIIDEISMVGSTLFSRVDTRLRQIKGVNASFGGISVICVGDLHQLPPVMDAPIFKPSKGNEMSEFFDSNPLWEEFSFYELSEIMRQKNEANFIKALNNLAVGKMTKDDVDFIKSREVTGEEVPDEAMRLFSENNEVEIFNYRKIENFPGQLYISEAKDNILGKVTEKTRSSILKSLLTKKASELNGLPHSINLKIGIRYMITNNIDVEDGLVNGACGVLKHIVFKANTLEPRQIWLDFSSHDIGKKARLPFANQMKNEGIGHNLTPIMKMSSILNISNKLNFQVTRQQYPIIPAEALTIHKSQGQSYETVCVDFNRMKRITRPMLYVALSRVKSLSGLFILGNFKPPKFSLKDTTHEELQNMKANKKIQESTDFECMSGFKIAYLNVNALYKKHMSVCNDGWYNESDILIFSETLMSPQYEFKLPNFHQVLRSDITGNTRGLLIFAKRNDARIEQHIIFSEVDSHIELVMLNIDNFFILTGYKSPRHSNSNFEENIEKLLNITLTKSERKLVIIGDFNCNIINGKNRRLIDVLSNYGLKSELPIDAVTTNLSSQIDVIFSNFDHVKCGTHETYFSYHKAVYIILNEAATNDSSQQENLCKKIQEKISISQNLENTENLVKRKIKTNVRDITANEITILLNPEGYLEDSHIDLFGEIISSLGFFNMQSVLYVQMPENIMPIPTGEKNLQIVYSSSPGSFVGHWICTYHDGTENHIYDSMNNRYLERDSDTYIKKLYGQGVCNIFHDVQRQTNAYDCGLFAMAFAVSICLGKDPTTEIYIQKLMREHAAKIFSMKSLLSFPTK